MNIQMLDCPVGQLVAERPARSRVFERWGIDYCCGGKKALSVVCATKNLDASQIIRELEKSDNTVTTTGADWTVEPMAALCDHIVSAHHDYLRTALPRLSMLTAKVADRHGPKDDRLVELAAEFECFRSEMISHMGKEEQILFPAIRSLDAGSPHREIESPVSVMLAEHDNAGQSLAKMRSLTDNFIAAESACNTHRAMLDGLAELEADMHQHVHKENNILFPRALAKESTLA